MKIPTSQAPVPSTETHAVVGSPSSEPRPLAPQVVAWLLILGAAVLVPLAYMRTFEPGSIHPLGWDSYAYQWEAEAVGSVGLEGLGSRPGPAVLGSFVVGTLPVPPSVQPLITSMVMVIALGLATAVTLRRALRLPTWTLGLIAAAVALWGGTGRMAAGYVANLMSLTIFIAAVSLVALGEGGAWSWAAAFGLFLTADLVHPGLAPVFTGVLVGLALVSVPWIVRQARAGQGWWRTEPVAGAAIGVAALVCAAAILFGPLGLRLSGIADFSAVSTFFNERLAKLPEQVGLWVTLSFASVGIVVAWRCERTHGSEIVARLGAAWLLGSVAAFLAVALGVRIPGHRVAYMALPVATLCGVAVAGVATRIAGFQEEEGPRGLAGSVRWGAGIMVGIAGVGMLASAGLTAFSGYVRAPRADWEDAGGLVAAYAELAQPQVPIVMVVDREDLWGALTSKVYLNAAKAELDPTYRDDFVIYVGRPENASAGRPTLFGDVDTDWHATFDEISSATWSSARSAIAAGAMILMPRTAVDPTIFEQATARDPGRLASEDLYVVRGPVVALVAPISPPPISSLNGLALVIATWLLFVLVGGGFCLAAARRLHMRAIEALGWSAAVGVGVCVLTCFILVAVGGDPSSTIGLLAVGAVALSGYGLALRSLP